jgi:glycosyltransferase involved in cell wall biosynthesis
MTPRRPGRLRILKFLTHFFIGGTERQFVYIANGLDRARFVVDIACLKRDGPLLDRLNPDMDVHTYPVYGTSYSARSILSQFRLMKDVRRRGYDIVHTYGWYPNVFAVPASRAALRPSVIASVRDAGAYLTPAKIKALKLMCALADCVLANSNAGRDWLIAQGVRENKIEVIRNGIVVPPQPERLQAAGPLRSEFGIPAGIPICASVGRLVSGKGIDVFLKAARILQERGLDVRFLLIGVRSVEKNYQAEVEELVRRLRIGNRVIFTGQRHDVQAILPEVDIVVQPSLTEGLSNAILEAMAAAVPVVATRVGGNPELVDDGRTGFLTPVQNPEAIAGAICRLLDRPDMARAFGIQARRRVIEEFAIDRMLSKTEALYFHLRERRRAWPERKSVTLQGSCEP